MNCTNRHPNEMFQIQIWDSQTKLVFEFEEFLVAHSAYSSSKLDIVGL